MNVDVSPDMQFYNLLESYPYDPKGALCEYIDNALEAFNSAPENVKNDLGNKLKIDIDFSPDRIIVADFGVGITLQELQRAVKPAYAASKKSLSEFGIGMKAASIWFGRKWELTSYPYGSKDKFDFVFDLDSLLLKKEEIVEVKVAEKQNKGQSSGLLITLSKLKRTIELRVAESVWDEIQETYQLFTLGENPILEISFSFQRTPLPQKTIENPGKSPLVYPICKFKHGKGLYVIGEPLTWKRAISFKFNDLPVTGFISLRSVSSQVSNPGIRLFRYGRLIQGHEKKPYRPVTLLGAANKHAPSRFYGELHLDGQPISNSKGGFVFDEALFLSTLQAQDGVEDYISQAENYRAKLVNEGNVINCKNTSEYEKQSGTAPGKSNKTKPKTSSASQNKRTSRKKTSNSPMDFLKTISAPDDFLMLDNIVDECLRLYKEGRWWSFCLCYRVFLEISIIQKIKHMSQEHYDHVMNKSVSGLFKYLHSNSDIIPSSYRTLRRVLRSHALEENPFIDLLNLSSHGHYVPVKVEIDNLLVNTQQLIEWIYSDD